jgi:hypothetical protein
MVARIVDPPGALDNGGEAIGRADHQTPQIVRQFMFGPRARLRTIDYYVWLMSDWAYLGGVRFVQMAARQGVTINHIPMRIQDVYAARGVVLFAETSWQRQAYRTHELNRWSTRLEVGVNIGARFFPANNDLASCMVIAAQRRRLSVADFVNWIMTSIWAEDQPGRSGPHRANRPCISALIGRRVPAG